MPRNDQHRGCAHGAPDAAKSAPLHGRLSRLATCRRFGHRDLLPGMDNSVTGQLASSRALPVDHRQSSHGYPATNLSTPPATARRAWIGISTLLDNSGSLFAFCYPSALALLPPSA